MSNKRLYNIILVNYPSLLNNFRSSSETKLPSLEDARSQPVVSVKLQPMTRDHSLEKDEVTEILLSPMEKTDRSEFTETKIVKKQDSKGERKEWLKKQFSVNYHYLKDLRMPKASIMHRNAMMNISKYKLRASSCPNIYRNSMISLDEKEEVGYL